MLLPLLSASATTHTLQHPGSSPRLLGACAAMPQPSAAASELPAAGNLLAAAAGVGQAAWEVPPTCPNRGRPSLLQ